MASDQQNAYCVLDLAKTNSITTVHWHFRTCFDKEPTSRKNIYCYNQFEEAGSVCKIVKGGAQGVHVYQMWMSIELEKLSKQARKNACA
jgi:hypothetical protein